MLTFVHGWGFTPTIWDPIRARLPQPTIAVDLGYGSAPPSPLPTIERVIGIGHSYGVLWLLQQMPGQLAGLVAINGFARFTAAPGWPQGAPPRVLARMRRAYAADPDTVLASFRDRCGAPPWIASRNDARLAADLDRLAQADARTALRDLRIPIACLAAPDDPLVAPEVSRAFAALARTDCRFAAAGGHLLPTTQPDWCATHIAALAGCCQ